MMRRVNEVMTIADSFGTSPALQAIRRARTVEIIAIPLTAAEACRVAEFELRTGVKIEAAILSFLDDELFNVASAPAREQSTSSSAE